MPSRAQRGAAPGRVLKGGPSKLRGVIWHKSNGKWEARIYEAGKQRFLGYYTSEVAAAKAYDARAVQLHGAAAKVNFPEEYEETRNSPPAVKPGYSLALQAGDGESPPRYKRKSPKNSSLNSATTRPGRRQDDGDDEDYIQPVHAERGLSHQRRLSARKLALAGSPAPAPESEEQSCDSEFEDERRLEQGAVEVLASLRSSSSDNSWHGGVSFARQLMLEDDLLDSPPVSSTGASPVPAPKSRVFEGPPMVWPAVDENAAPAQSSCQLGPVVKEAALEDCVESQQAPQPPQRFSRKRRASTMESFDGSCSETEEMEATPLAHYTQWKGVSWNSVCGKWVATIWDRQAKRARHIGSFDDPLKAARAYDREAARSTPAVPMAPLSEVKRAPEPASGNENFRPISIQQQRAVKGVARAPGVRPARGSSRFRGVSWCEKGQKWRALIWDGHRQHFLGHYKSEEEGARAYDRALLTRKKKDGLLNFPLADYTDLLATLSGTPASEFLKPGQTPCSQEKLAPVAEVDHHIARSVTRPRRAAARNLTPKQIDGELGAEDSCDEEGSVAVPAGGSGLLRSKTTHGSSRFKGVSWSVRSGKWRAQMWLGAKVLHLGFFDDELEAAKAYDTAVMAHKGPGAAANFSPGEGDAVQLDLGPADSRGTASFRGVRWHERNNKWEARIFDGQRQVSLGYYNTEVEAAVAFDAAALQLRGPATCTNFVPPAGAGKLEEGINGGDSLFSAGWGTKKRRN